MSIKRVREIFWTKEDILRSVFTDYLPLIAEQMWDASIIGPLTKKNPSYEKIVEEFFNSLELVEDKEIEQECTKFLAILNRVCEGRGAASKAVLWLEKELGTCNY